MKSLATVLVVDDEPLNIKSIAYELKQDYEVLVSTSGQDALSLLANIPAPDLILLDVCMPELDGYQTCQALKQNPRTRHVPVIFLTSKDTDEDEERGLKVGAVDFLKKPFRPAIDLQRMSLHIKLAQEAHSQAHLHPQANQISVLPELSEREQEVLALISKGLTRNEVADLLKVSPYTIGDHIKSLYKKLNVNSRSEVTRLAIQMGLV